MYQLMQNIGVEYSCGLLKVFAVIGEVLPFRFSFKFSYFFQKTSGIKVFVWPVDKASWLEPSFYIKSQDCRSKFNQYRLDLSIEQDGGGEFSLYADNSDNIKYSCSFLVGNDVKIMGNAEIMEKAYNLFYVSNNALALYKKLIKKESVRKSLKKKELSDIKELTERLSLAIREENLYEAKKSLDLLSKWDFRLSCC